MFVSFVGYKAVGWDRLQAAGWDRLQAIGLDRLQAAWDIVEQLAFLVASDCKPVPDRLMEDFLL